MCIRAKLKLVFRHLNRVVQSLPDAVPILVDDLEPRPVVGLIRRQTPSHRVDAEGEKPVELGVKACQTAGTAEQVLIECFQVADVEDDAVALLNGAIIHRFGPDDPEEFVRLRSSLEKP